MSRPASFGGWTAIIPNPLSTNALFTGRRFKTRRYRDWMTDAGWALKLPPQGWPGIPNRPFAVRLRCKIVLPPSSKIDVDNIKCVLDLLTEMRVIEDDKLIDALSIERGDVTWCQVSLKAIT